MTPLDALRIFLVVTLRIAIVTAGTLALARLAIGGGLDEATVAGIAIGMGLAFAIFQLVGVSGRRFAQSSWLERAAVRHHGVEDVHADKSRALRFCTDELPKKMRAEQVETTGDTISFLIPWDYRTWGTRVSLRVLDGPVGRSHVAYTIRPRVRGTLVDTGAGLQAAYDIRDSLATL